MTLRRLFPEQLLASDLRNRHALGEGQVAGILTRLIAAGAVRRLGRGSGSAYSATSGLLPSHARGGLRPRRLGFGEEWRRRYQGSRVTEPKEAAGPTSPADGPEP